VHPKAWSPGLITLNMKPLTPKVYTIFQNLESLLSKRKHDTLKSCVRIINPSSGEILGGRIGGERRRIRRSALAYTRCTRITPVKSRESSETETLDSFGVNYSTKFKKKFHHTRAPYSMTINELYTMHHRQSIIFLISCVTELLTKGQRASGARDRRQGHRVCST